MTWRLANSLDTLRNEFNAAYPNRSRAFDGTIGDANHASRCSRHNPNNDDVVCALDVTHDPAHGCDVHADARRLVALAKRGLTNHDFEYVASNGKIASRSQGWVWRDYNGASQHAEHAHFAVGRGTDCEATAPYDSTTPWGIAGGHYRMLYYGKRGTVDQQTASAVATAVGTTSTVDLAEAEKQKESGGRLIIVGGPACAEFGYNNPGSTKTQGNVTYVHGSNAKDTGRRVFEV